MLMIDIYGSKPPKLNIAEILLDGVLFNIHLKINIGLPRDQFMYFRSLQLLQKFQFLRNHFQPSYSNFLWFIDEIYLMLANFCFFTENYESHVI